MAERRAVTSVTRTRRYPSHWVSDIIGRDILSFQVCGVACYQSNHKQYRQLVVHAHGVSPFGLTAYAYALDGDRGLDAGLAVCF